MATVSTPLLLCAFFLYHVTSLAAFSSSQREAAAARESLPRLCSGNMSFIAASQVQDSDYMLRLFLKLSRPSGEVVNPGAVKGNHIHGFVDNDGCNDRIFKFNTHLLWREHVKFVELGLYKIPSTFKTPPNSTATIQIIDIKSANQIASQRVTIEIVGWITFVLPRHVVKRWNRKPDSNAGISVKVTEQGLSRAVTFATRLTNATFQAILVVHCGDPQAIFPEGRSFSPKMKPRRRSVRSKHSNHAGKCQIHNLTVYFTDLGWDKWIIVPQMYSANYCAGTCLDRFNNKMSNHALVQLLVHQTHPDLTHAPCCVPKHMTSISILYRGGPGESTFVLKKVDDVVTKSCACR